MVIELKREGDRVKAALYEDSSVRRLCCGSPEHCKVSFEWLGRRGVTWEETPLLCDQSSQIYLSLSNVVPYFLRAAFQEHVLFLQTLVCPEQLNSSKELPPSIFLSDLGQLHLGPETQISRYFEKLLCAGEGLSTMLSQSSSCSQRCVGENRTCVIHKWRYKYLLYFYPRVCERGGKWGVKIPWKS